MPDRREAIFIASTNASRPSKKRILTVCVKLFLEQGYKKTTVAQIVQQASVSNSIFQNIFRAKDGVLTELAQFMLSNQFAMARSTAGTQLPPIYVYAVETAIQMTLTELNENLREIYIEAYTQKEASDYIFRETAKELYQIFSPYQPELTEQDFYFMEIGSAGIMRGFMAYPCDGELTLENEGWLEDYALYMALKTANGMKSWTQWPREYRKREPQALEAFKAENEEEIGFWKFLQYEFSIQWKKLKAYANANNVQILGDIPIYVSADSVDAWVGGPLFELDADGGFARVAGCPPDYFSADGQLWGNPLYNWPYHKQTGYAWWIQRVRHALGIYDLLRIDHFRGFDTYWAIPADSTTAKTGKWETGPRMELFNALEGALGKLPIIAEDLGELFPSVRELLADSTFPGMKVLQFAFGGGDSEYLPHNHVKNSVVYPGTHDNTTLTAWWDESASAKEKAVAAAYLHLTGCQPTAKEVAAVKTEAARTALLRAALGSVADRAIIPMADWLGLGEEAHLNSPGKLGGNWSWRAADGFDTAALAKRILAECAVYCRTEPGRKPGACLAV